MSAQWIVVKKWKEFQHYHDRWVPWIKFYLELQHDNDWLSLPVGRRGMLCSLWLEYAQSRCRLPADTRELSRRINARFRQDDIEALVQAGFIEICSRPNLEHVEMASRPTRARKEAEAEQEKEQEQSSSTSTQDLPFEKELAATRLLAAIGATNGTTREALDRYELPPAAWYAAAEELELTAGIRNRAGYVVTMFRTWKQEGRYA